MVTATTETDATFAPLITLFPLGDSNAISIPKSAYSLRGFRGWALSEEFPTRGHYTFVAGELIIDMSPELFETHNFIKMDVGSALNQLVQRRKLGRVFGDRALYSNENADICTEPDVMFVSGESVRTGRCKRIVSSRPGSNIEIVGSPDMILEVVSPTSIKKDKVILRDGYYRAGVGEYWIIDALGKDLDFQILVPDKDSYIPVEPRDGWLPSPTFGCSFRLTAAKDDDEFVTYVLHIQEAA
jgi:Uma2 family endonuclease